MCLRRFVERFAVVIYITCVQAGCLCVYLMSETEVTLHRQIWNLQTCYWFSDFSFFAQLYLLIFLFLQSHGTVTKCYIWPSYIAIWSCFCLYEMTWVVTSLVCWNVGDTVICLEFSDMSVCFNWFSQSHSCYILALCCIGSSCSVIWT